MNNRLRLRLLLPIAIAIFVAMVLTLGWILRGDVNGLNKPLNNGWKLSYRNTTAVVENLNNYSFPSIFRKGDSILFQRELPENLKANSALRIKTSLSAIEFFVNDSLVYSYGKNALMLHKMVGSGYHYIYLPPNAAGKRITLRIISSEQNIFPSLPEVYLCDDRNVSTVVFSEHVVSFLIGLFLAILGFLTTTFCMFAILFERRFYRLLITGVWAFLLGIWSLCYMKTFQIFTLNYELLSTIEYISLYFSPLPLYLLIYDIRKKKLTGWRIKGLRIFIFFSAGFATISIFSHFSDILHFPNFLPVLHTLVFSSIVYVIACGVLRDPKAELSEKLVPYGIVVFGCFAGMDLIRYNVQKYFTLDGFIWNTSFMPIGIFLFVLFLFSSYVMYLFSMIADRTEKEVLAGLVYKDPLTDLYNRAKADQIFEVLDKGTLDYAIVSIDMNGLKKTNDTYGHSKGDLLIDTFAEVLRDAFNGIGTSIRMGGDEFVEIIREEHLIELDAALDKMRMLEQEKSAQLPIPLSVAFGVAKWSECGNKTAEEVYRRADKRMYEMKELQHQKC